MSEPQTLRWPWAVWASMLCLVAAALTLSLANGTFDTFVAIAVPMMVGYGTIGAFVASRVRGNPIGWLMLTVGLSFAVIAISSEYLVWAVRNDAPLQALSAWLSNWVYVVTFLPLPLILLLFPTGRVMSPRWRIVSYVIVGSAAILAVAAWIRPGDVGAEVPFENPTGVPALEPLSSVLSTIGVLGVFVSALASVVALVVRYRRSPDLERRQIRAVSYVAGVALALLVPTFVTDGSPVLNDVFFYAFLICIGVAFPAAIGWAIVRHRLYNIDLVVKKTVVVGTLVVFTIAVYVVAAVLVQRFATDQGTTVAFVAGLVVALAFGPVRRFARRLGDRMVYGARATPYEVLTAFGDRVGEGYSVEDVLPRMVALLAEGTGATVARVWLRVGDDMRPVAAWPADAMTARSLRIADGELASFEGEDGFPVKHQGELLGAISVAFPPGDPITPAKSRLVEDLAAQAGLVLQNVRLVEDLRASRKRLVAAQDEERRRLERNIHDGAQQQLVALSVKLRLLEQLAPREPAKAAEMASELQSETATALEDLRDLARGIYPPLLADKGLPSALEAQARKASLPVSVAPDGVGRYAPEIESALYFCCLEALQNVAKYAHATRADVRLSASLDELAFEVVDDGDGFDPSSSHGTGLQGMVDRMEALGGTLEIHSQEGGGTTVSGRIPAPATPA